jgi:hypothetical protein
LFPPSSFTTVLLTASKSKGFDRINSLCKMSGIASVCSLVQGQMDLQLEPGALRARLWAMCFGVVKFSGALPVLMRHSSSRKTMSSTQCRTTACDCGSWSNRQREQGEQGERGDIKAGLLLHLSAVGSASIRHRRGWLAHSGPSTALLLPRLLIGRRPSVGKKYAEQSSLRFPRLSSLD